MTSVEYGTFFGSNSHPSGESYTTICQEVDTLDTLDDEAATSRLVKVPGDGLAGWAGHAWYAW
jgi:hypothetical protein